MRNISYTRYKQSLHSIQQHGQLKISTLVFILTVITLTLSGLYFVKTYNSLQTADVAVSQNWAEVMNQYQRRIDLIPNLVTTVERYADHEKSTLTEIAGLRNQINEITPLLKQNPNDEALQTQWQTKQNQLGQSLSKLVISSENYPVLLSNELFSNLMVQLEGTENRITVARKRYSDAVANFNLEIRKFPTVIIANVLNMQEKQNLATLNTQVPTEPFKISF